MDKRSFSSILLAALAAADLGLAQAQNPGVTPASSPPTAGPKIQFDNTTFDFGKVDSGEVVRHDFVFTNVGTVLLEIKEVRASCGCTTPGNWDKQVLPGKTGIIPLQFNSSAFSGPITKSASVVCNDPAQSNLVLYIKGNVYKPIEVMPTIAFFNVSSDTSTNEIRTIRIVNHLDDPVELSDLQCSNRAFQVELKTVLPGKEFQLLVTALAPFTSNSVMAAVTLKTSSPKVPTIHINAQIMVQQPVTVSPMQIVLPPGPLAKSSRSLITVRIAGTNSVVVSEPVIDAPGVHAHLQEIQPGKFFHITVEFPAGFRAPPGNKLYVTAKTTHPKLPLIQVPVYQSGAVSPPAGSNASPLQVTPAKTQAPARAGK